MSKTDCKAAQELAEAMETTMQRLQERFLAMSEQLESRNILFPPPFSLSKVQVMQLFSPSPSIADTCTWHHCISRPFGCLLFIGRVQISLTCTLDQMGTRIDELEKNVTELMTQAGMEDQSSSQ
ncbi:heat shock factor-binding protein 1-like protein 1 [Fundulus diaphanus]